MQDERNKKRDALEKKPETTVHKTEAFDEKGGRQNTRCKDANYTDEQLIEKKKTCVQCTKAARNSFVLHETLASSVVVNFHKWRIELSRKWMGAFVPARPTQLQNLSNTSKDGVATHHPPQLGPPPPFEPTYDPREEV